MIWALIFISFWVQGDDIYDAMLNQTNVGDNNNKFYVIQVLGNISFYSSYFSIHRVVIWDELVK